jgi:Domain of unknown function (DUF4407)
MEYEPYKAPSSTRLMRFFWECAGGDRLILERSTYSDHIKYMCLGGIIFATGFMAAVSGGYAFYTIFEPRGNALDSNFHVPTALLSCVFGVFWGLMIFNLDRFIVSSTGTGDGTEAITLDELKGAIPRIVMGAIIALTISKPVEIRMFKTEIDIRLRERQLEQQTAYQEKVDKSFSEREQNLRRKMGNLESERRSLIDRIVEFERQYQNEMTKGQGGRGAGEGPVALSLKAQKEKLEGSLAAFDADHQVELTTMKDEERQLAQDKEKERRNNEKVANNLDGLLERIKLAHEVAGFWISLFVTLLFVAIELTPIFFKLMLIKSPYDFLKENISELIKAENGVHVQYNYHKDKNGQERDLVVHFNKEKLVAEAKGWHEAQARLAEYAIAKYEEQMKQEIDDDPQKFVKGLQAPLEKS